MIIPWFAPYNGAPPGVEIDWSNRDERRAA